MKRQKEAKIEYTQEDFYFHFQREKKLLTILDCQQYRIVENGNNNFTVSQNIQCIKKFHILDFA